jgi:2-iminoacetate synthase ThiH
METQPENHDGKRRVSSEEILAVLLELKELVQLEKKAKEQQNAKDSSHQVTYSFRA